MLLTSRSMSLSIDDPWVRQPDSTTALALIGVYWRLGRADRAGRWEDGGVDAGVTSPPAGGQWQLVVPLSVKVLPGIGMNCHS
jgi:hypothetical protein